MRTQTQLADSGTKLKMPSTSIANWSHHCISDLSAKASEESKPLLPTPAADRRKSGPCLGPPPAKGQSHLVHDPPRDSHAVEDGDVDDSRHAPIVDGLGAVGPHVRTLGQVDVTGAQTETDRTVLQETESGTAMMRHNRRKSHQGRPESQPGLGTWPHSTPCSEEASLQASRPRPWHSGVCGHHLCPTSLEPAAGEEQAHEWPEGRPGLSLKSWGKYGLFNDWTWDK